MLTESVIDIVNSMLPTGKVTLKDKSSLQLVTQDKIRNLSIPTKWKSEPHDQDGYYGTLIHSGRSVRFVRAKVTPKTKHKILKELDAYINDKIDMRSIEIKKYIEDTILPNNIIIEDFECQLAEAIALAINHQINNIPIDKRAESDFRNKINDFLTRFPICKTNINDQSTQKTSFYQNQLVIGYKDFPQGADIFVRDSIIKSLCNMGTFKNIRGDERYKADPSSTSKNDPGKWITLIKTKVFRNTPEGIKEYNELNEPVIKSAIIPISGNPKRDNREVSGLKNALPLKNPKPCNSISNGLEGHAGEAITSCMTEICVLFASFPELNVYHHNSDKILLDDILITKAGHEALTTIYNEKTIYSIEEWNNIADNYLDEKEKPLEGISLQWNNTLETSITDGNTTKELHSLEVQVTNANQVESWTIGKGLFGCHKAMMKPIKDTLIAKEPSGKEYEIEVIIAPESIVEKKIPELVLQGVLGRLQYGYIENFQKPIHINRKAEDSLDKYEDLVWEASELLKQLGLPESGKLDIYSRTEEGDTFLGEAIVGIVRGSRLMENEQSSSKVHMTRACPVQSTIRPQLKARLELDKNSQTTIDHLHNLYTQIKGSKIAK